MSRIGMYDHLEPITVPVDMDALAEIVENANYGTHRFLSALIRVRRAKAVKNNWKQDILCDEIKKLLDQGLF